MMRSFDDDVITLTAYIMRQMKIFTMLFLQKSVHNFFSDR